MSVSETSKQLHTILPRGTAAPVGRGARASAGGMGTPFCICSFSQAAAPVSPASRAPTMRPFASIQIRLAMARAAHEPAPPVHGDEYVAAALLGRGFGAQQDLAAPAGDAHAVPAPDTARS